MTVNTTLSDWHVRAYARYGSHSEGTFALHFGALDHFTNPEGIADRYVDACFDEDAPASSLPRSSADWDAAAPFTGLWVPSGGDPLLSA